MGFRADILGLLACPFCASPIRLDAVLEEGEAGIEYGRLACAACGFRYPIVAGVAIIGGPNERLDIKEETTADTLIRGPRVGELADRLEAGDKAGALALLLSPSSLRGDLFPRLDTAKTTSSPPATGGGVMNRLLGARTRRLRKLAKAGVAKLTLRRARERLAAFLTTGDGARLSALDLLELYYRRYSGAETFTYFAYRFGQPRHLAALALASTVNRSDGPVLDLACGLGHLTHFFTSARPRRPVIAADRDFFRLYVAAHHVAPGASYLCFPADQALPFATGALDGVFCSDAFHYFLYRAQSVREMTRVLAPTGTLALARFGNAAVEPREGYELDVAGYRRLLSGLTASFLGEARLLQGYLEQRGPDAAGEDDAQLAGQKWLSVVASRGPAGAAPAATFADFPHAAGRLQLNPIYQIERRGPKGELDLRFVFPSEWYRFENEAYLRYAPERISVPADIVGALETGAPHPGLSDLIAKCVVIGMPERYVTSG
jgi:SAM-dependent methyltransferase/uncharacterized protein YbaR (Trm112 family)